MTSRHVLLFAESEFLGTGNVRTTPSHSVAASQETSDINSAAVLQVSETPTQCHSGAIDPPSKSPSERLGTLET